MKTQIAYHFSTLTLVVMVSLSLSGKGMAFTQFIRNFPNGGPNSIISGATGLPISVGTGIVAGGYFTISDAAIATATSMAELDAAFVQFGDSDNMNGSGFGVDGWYSTSTTQLISETVNTHFHGETLYSFIGNGSSFLTSTEALIVKHVGVQYAKAPAIGNTGVLADFLLEPIGSTQLLLGAFPGDDVPTPLGSFPAFETVYVPEPSRGVLALTGIVALGLKRTRKNLNKE